MLRQRLMLRWTSLFTNRLPKGVRRKRRSESALTRRLTVEALEDRRMLAVITVDSLADNTTGDDMVTLREAVQAANMDTSVDGSTPGNGDDIIQFAAALDGMTITLTAGALDTITEGLTIDASALPNGLTIDASGSDPTPAAAPAGDGIRIFNFDDGNDAVDLDMAVNGLTLTGGDVTGDGGAIRSRENLTVTGSIISGNSASDDGGGIFLGFASLATITNSLITGNTAGNDGGGLYGTNTTSVNITDSTFSGNQAADKGGGVYLELGSTVSITSSTISGNTAVDSGGGLYLDYNTTVTITSSTISGNEADNDGGGIWAAVDAGKTLTIQHSTITENISDADSGGAGSGGGLYADFGTGTITFENTIIAGNTDNTGTAPDIDNTTPATNPTLNTSFTLVGTNVGSGLVAGGLIGGGVPINPMLGFLTNNGGPTETHALLAGSPALNTGNPAFIGPPTSDQRGAPFLRVAGGQLDIGAYERQTVAALNLVVDTLVDENDGDYSPGDLSLREAVGLANGSISADTITFAGALDGGTILLELVRGDLDVTGAVIIDATALPTGITVDAGNGADGVFNTGDGIRIFDIDDGQAGDIDVEIRGLTLTGGDVDDVGGAIQSLENLTVIDSVITGNSAGGGGGIYSAYAALTITDSTISENNAGNGGGIQAFGTTTTITDSTISGNTVSNDGGGIDAYDAEISITRSMISGNSAGGDGGGIFVADVTTTITDSTISGNTAPNGGGVSATGGTLGVAYSTIDNNYANVNGNGGGFYLDEVVMTLIDSSTISNNRADDHGGGLFVRTIDDDGTDQEVRIQHSTITGNTADSNNASVGAGGGMYLDNGLGDVILDHTIVAQNLNDTNGYLDIYNRPGGSDPIITATFSLVGDNTGVAAMLPAGNPDGDGNKIGTAAAPIDAMLEELEFNGGPTRTHALKDTSPAIDMGDPDFVPPPANDQRGLGFPRVLDGDEDDVPIIDIGAYEFRVFPPAVIGVWAAGSVLIDTNGNFMFDPAFPGEPDGDLAFRIGFGSDYIFAGNFSGPGPDTDFGTLDDTTAPAGDAVADGFDKLAAYGRINSTDYRWLFDIDNNGVADFSITDPAAFNGYPVAGNFDGNLANGDEVGLFDGQFWYFDTDHDFNVDLKIAASGYQGFPIAGDFNGDGNDDVATYIASSAGGNLFSVDLNEALPGDPILIDGIANYSFRVGSPFTGGFGFAGVRERPVAADFNADGIDDFGLWVPDGIVPVPNELSEWYLLLSGDDPFTTKVEETVLDRIQEGPLNGFVPFSPFPFGNDLYAQFGNTFSLPIAGRFAAPVIMEEPPPEPDPPIILVTAQASAEPAETSPVTPETSPVVADSSRPSKPFINRFKRRTVKEVVEAPIEQAITELADSAPNITSDSEEPVEAPAVEVVSKQLSETEQPAHAKTEPTPSLLLEELTTTIEVGVETAEAPTAAVTEQAPKAMEPKVLVASEPVTTEQTPEAPVQSSLQEEMTPIVETEVAIPETPKEAVAKQAPAEPKPEVVAATEAVVVEVTAAAPAEEIPVAPVDPPIQPYSRSRVRSLSFGGSRTVASVSTQSVPPPVVEPAESQPTAAVELVVEIPPLKEVVQAPVVEISTDIPTSILLAPDPTKVDAEATSSPRSEQSKGNETDSLSQDTATDLNVSPSTSRSRTRTLIYVQGKSNDQISAQTPNLATGYTANSEQLAYSGDLTNDGSDPTQKKTAITDAVFDNASQLEFIRVDAEVVDELSRLSADPNTIEDWLIFAESSE